MVDGVADDEDGGEDDTLRTPSGSRKRVPYLARQRCHGKPRPPMGPGGPLLVRQGDVAFHKEQTSVGQHDRDHTGNFTQVRAATRCKTLLMLWWIDGGRVVVERSTLTWQGRQWLHAYGRVCSPPSNPLYGFHGPPFID